jgi:hypothetical protein
MLPPDTQDAEQPIAQLESIHHYKEETEVPQQSPQQTLEELQVEQQQQDKQQQTVVQQQESQQAPVQQPTHIVSNTGIVVTNSPHSVQRNANRPLPTPIRKQTTPASMASSTTTTPQSSPHVSRLPSKTSTTVSTGSSAPPTPNPPRKQPVTPSGSQNEPNTSLSTNVATEPASPSLERSDRPKTTKERAPQYATMTKVDTKSLISRFEQK